MATDLSNIPDLGSRQLLAVLAIADYGSFIAAAAFLKTSQPALTRTCAGGTGGGHRSRGRHRGLQYRRAQDAADHPADAVAQPGTHHAQGTRANPRGHRHLEADPLGLVDRSGLMRFKQ